jgi:hypothetical protein
MALGSCLRFSDQSIFFSSFLQASRLTSAQSKLSVPFSALAVCRLTACDEMDHGHPDG